MRRSGLVRSSLYAAFALVAFVFPLSPVAVQASGPAHTETLAAGPYLVQVNLFQYPPVTDQSDVVMVVPQEGSAQLSGSITLAS